MGNKFLKLPADLLSFLKQHYLQTLPQTSFLLALSGGIDSLALFYSLLACQQKSSFSFHVAHVDHGWREESRQEAEMLQKLCQVHEIPFHLKQLNSKNIEGNLEQACRKERLAFFKKICLQYHLQAVFLGHHRDDQAETVLKKVLEGSHWSLLGSLKEKTIIDGLCLLRPWLGKSKKELAAYLTQLKVNAFDDSTNRDVRFLRARMRQHLLPWLSKSFGKNVASSLSHLAAEIEELSQELQEELKPLLSKQVKGPFGTFLDLQLPTFLSKAKLKFLFYLFCKQEDFFISKDQHRLCVEALLANKANLRFESKGKILYIDRRRIFLFEPSNKKRGEWVAIWSKKQVAHHSCWQAVWQGRCSAFLPHQNYQLVYRKQLSRPLKTLDRWWSHHSVPAFLRDICPLVCLEGEIIHEFLTGKSLSKEHVKEEKRQIILRYLTIE